MGTSLSCPCWGAIISLADQGRSDLGMSTLDGPSATLPAIYDLLEPDGDFNDITSGNNGTLNAMTGYDAVTGWGTPKANLVVRDLASLVVVQESSGPDTIAASESGTVLSVTVNSGTPTNYTTNGRTELLVEVSGSDNLININSNVTLNTCLIGGYSGSDTINGGSGDNTIDGQGGADDSLTGGSSNDLIMAGGSSGGSGDILTGLAGNDTLIAGAAGGDALHGTGGNDFIVGVTGSADTLLSGTGDDTCYQDSSDSISGSFAEDETVSGDLLVDIFANAAITPSSIGD